MQLCEGGAEGMIDLSHVKQNANNTDRLFKSFLQYIHTQHFFRTVHNAVEVFFIDNILYF